MVTVIVSRDGRTWYGRKRYRVRLENVQGGKLNTGWMLATDASAMVLRILEREVAEGRPFRFIDNT